MTQSEELLERIVKKYPYEDSALLFKEDLKSLVSSAKEEERVKSLENVLKMIDYRMNKENSLEYDNAIFFLKRDVENALLKD